jgi:AmmeMemoRadiSam system protein B
VRTLVTDDHTHWKTPIGMVQVQTGNFKVDATAHLNEHCLEVQLPFLQKLMPHLEIMPLLISEVQDVNRYALQVLPHLDDDTLLLISTDLSHYNPYEQAIQKDRITIKAITEMDEHLLIKSGDACGMAAVLLSLAIAKKCNWKVQKLCYRNSGDMGAEMSSVVGYASFVFTN